MVESKGSRWYISDYAGGELVMKGEWSAASMHLSISHDEVISATDSRARVVLMIAEMQSQHGAALADVQRAGAAYMSTAQLAELNSLVDWLKTEGSGYYVRVQAGVYLTSDDNIAASVERIVRAYQQMGSRLVDSLLQAEGEAKGEAGMHLAEWMADTPARLAFRLQQFGLDVGPSSSEEKKRYVEKSSNAESVATFV